MRRIRYHGYHIDVNGLIYIRQAAVDFAHNSVQGRQLIWHILFLALTIRSILSGLMFCLWSWVG